MKGEEERDQEECMSKDKFKRGLLKTGIILVSQNFVSKLNKL